MNSKYSIFISVLIGVGLGLVAVFFLFRKPVQTQQIVDMPQIQESTTPLEKATPVLDQPLDVSWVSPDGKKTMVMKTVKNPEDTTTYSFSVSDSATESGQILYSKTVDSKTTMSIPFNTWSPGNQYVFIQEHTPTETMSYVFKATGALFPDAQPYLDINAIYASKKVEYKLREVTGWAAPTLLILNTDTADLKEGPSYWFDISNKALSRLSTTFP